MTAALPAGPGATALAALGGSLAAHALPALPGTGAVAAAAVAASVLLGVRRGRTVGVALMFFVLTVCVAGARLDDRWSAPSAQTDVPLHGWIDGFPQVNDARTVFTLRAFPVESAPAGAARSPVGGSGGPITATRRVPARIRLSWYAPPPGLAPGASLEILARLRAPRGLVNPGGFDYERWLLTEAIGATGYVREGRILPQRRYGIAQRWLRFRARLADAIRSRVADGFPAELLVALAVGVRSGFEDRHWAVFRRTGTSHLVAISGLHIGLIAAISFAVVLRAVLWLPYRLARHAWMAAATLAILPATAYAALAGFTVPTLRALLMLLVAQIVVVSRRRIAWGTGLSMALIVVLALSPMAPLGVSFWLSFGAVALIMMAAAMQPEVVPGVRPRRPRRRVVRTLVIVQLVLGLGLMPISAASFGEVSIAALAVNLVAVPVFSLVVVPLALVLVAATWLDVGAAPIGAIAYAVADFAWEGLVRVAALEHASFELGPPTTPVLVVALLAVSVFLAGPPRARWLTLFALLPLFVRAPQRLEPGAVSLTVLDVGHGLAVVVRTSHHALLYDTGPLSRSGFDAGREIVVPALRMLTGGSIDKLILSHGDSDHAGGFESVAERVPAHDRLLGPDVARAGEPACRAGQGWVWDQVTFTVVHPPPGFAALGNESSCVVRIDAPFGSALLTGDIEGRAEAALVAAGLGHAAVVVVPHHGSTTSSSAAFVRAVDADYAIVSAAFANRWNFPRPQVRSRWELSGAALLSTGESGAVTATIAPAGIRIETARQTGQAYWRARAAPLSGADTRSAL